MINLQLLTRSDYRTQPNAVVGTVLNISIRSKDSKFIRNETLRFFSPHWMRASKQSNNAPSGGESRNKLVTLLMILGRNYE